MELLMRNPGRVYGRENLLNVVWGYEYIGDFRTVDVHYPPPAGKLDAGPGNPEYIRSQVGSGVLSQRPWPAPPGKRLRKGVWKRCQSEKNRQAG